MSAFDADAADDMPAGRPGRIPVVCGTAAGLPSNG